MNRYLFVLLILSLMSTCLPGQEWQPLFNGHSFDGWTTGDGQPVTKAAWKVEEGGVLHLDTTEGRGGNILTDRTFGDFELVFEWNISEQGNNGIKYRVNDFDGKILGCEYQVIDDHGKELKPRHKTASLYDVYETLPHDILKPAGEWNRGRILVMGNTIEHWLNGHLVMSANVGSSEWKRRIGESKFRNVNDFGSTPRGRIMITDHNDAVRYRNVFVRELSTTYLHAADTNCHCCNLNSTVRCRPRWRLFRRR